MVSILDEGREALKELMKEAERYVSLQMKYEGHCPARLYMDGIDGKAILNPPEMSSEQAKDNFATLAKLVCVAHGANATVWVSEAWMLRTKKDENLDLSILPSESLDRQEAVIIMGESREGGFQKYLPILRHENGKFKGLGEANLEENQTKGRFAQFLPAEIPDKETRDMAKKALEGTVQRKEMWRGRGRGMTRE
jgi:hypothetical protein